MQYRTSLDKYTAKKIKGRLSFLWFMRIFGSFCFLLFTLFVYHIFVYRLFKKTIFSMWKFFLKKKFKKIRKMCWTFGSGYDIINKLSRESGEKPDKMGIWERQESKNECSGGLNSESKFKKKLENFRKSLKKVLTIAWRYDKILESCRTKVMKT